MEQNRLKNRAFFVCITLFVIFMTSCQNTGKQNRTVTVDNSFKDLFYADSNGITGADGIFSVLLPDGSSVFLLGDCFLGKVVNGARDINTTMMRNSFVVVNKEKTDVKAIYNGVYDNPVTLMEPVNVEGDSTYRWYWPGHGFVKDNTIYVFAINLYNEPSAVIKSEKTESEQDEIDRLAEEMWSFRISQIDLLSFKLPDFEHIETKKVDFDYTENQIDFGNCVMVDKDYVYIYGTKNLPFKSNIHVARVPFNGELFHNNWEYFTGTEWDKNIKKSAPIEIDISVSEQFSIFKYKDKYILLTQERAGADIYTYISSHPNKNFYNKTKIYHSPVFDLDTTHRIHSYNALAHSQYIENDKILVSYCVNSFRVRDVFENVENYRGRFLRVPMEMIVKEESEE